MDPSEARIHFGGGMAILVKHNINELARKLDSNF